MRRILLVIVVVSNSLLYAQEETKKKPIPVLHEVSNKDVVQSVFPEATKVEKENAYWFRIIDNNKNVLGFAMSSAPYCKDIIGYNNTTPVLIVTDKSLVIQKIAILSNWETLGYVRKLEKKGFFNLWNGYSIMKAKTIEPDGYSGATVTALAVSKNIDYILAKGEKSLPQKRK